MYKIKKVLSDLGLGETDDILNQSFVAELSAFNEAISSQSKTAEELSAMDDALVVSFYKLHTIEADPELEAAKKEAAEAKAERDRLKAEKEAENLAKSEQEQKIANEKAAAEEAERLAQEDFSAQQAQKTLIESELIDLLNKKRHWDYDDLRKLGIDPENIPNKISVLGFVLQKRHFLLEYTVIKKPSQDKK